MESMQDARYRYLSREKAPDWKPLEFLVQAMWAQTAGKLDNLSGTTAVGKASGPRPRFEKTRVAGYSPKHAKEAQTTAK